MMHGITNIRSALGLWILLSVLLDTATNATNAPTAADTTTHTTAIYTATTDTDAATTPTETDTTATNTATSASAAAAFTDRAPTATNNSTATDTTIATDKPTTTTTAATTTLAATKTATTPTDTDPSVEGNGNLGAISLSNCPRDELYRCFDIAEPLLKNPNYVFPSNKDDISIVCKTWDDFVDCVSHYTTSCLKTDRRQQHLLTALKESVRTFDEMCGNTDYQLDYLRHAPCIKSMATDEGKCKPQLSYLVDQVSALLISNTQTCCAHHAFRECMLEAAARHCDTFANGAAVQFARDIFSKAMGFLLKYCADYMPNAGDCVIATPSPSTVPAQYDSMLFNGQNGANLASGSYEDQNPSWGPIPSLSGIQIRQPRPTPSRPESFSSTPRSYSSSQWFAPVSTYSPPFFPTGVDNTLDTPNQQGLSSSAPNWTPSFLLATLTFVISWLFIAY